VRLCCGFFRLVFCSSLLTVNAFAHDPINTSKDTPLAVQKIYGKILNQGLIEPFENSVAFFSQQQTFEPSAVYMVEDKLFLINDRPMPENFPSQVVGFSIDQLGQEIIKPDSIFPVTSAVIHSSMKIEAATQSFDKRLVFASSSFSYFIEDEPEKDAFNSVLYWPSGKPNEAKRFNSSVRQGITSSLELRKRIQNILKTKQFPLGPTYFKVEGLAYMPGNKLAFGIRSSGVDYDSASYQFTIITAEIHSASSKNKATLLLSNFELLYKQNEQHKQKNRKHIKHDIGVSSLEYDTNRDGLFVITSFEDEDKNMGAYLWFYPNNKEPELVFTEQGTPLVFKHKAEAFLMLDESTLLIIHDDDREQLIVDTGKSKIKRDTNQGVYSVVKIYNSTTKN